MKENESSNRNGLGDGVENLLEEHSETLDQLSEQEIELLVDYIRKSAEGVGYIEGLSVMLSDRYDRMVVKEAIGEIEAISTENAENLTLQAYMFERLKENIVANLDGIAHPASEPSDEVIITREKLNKLLVADDVVQLFALTGSIIEQLSIELLLAEVVDPDRRSNTVREKVEQNMTQKHREWWLHKTGVLDDGEKGEVRRAYKLRSSLVHNPEGASLIDEIENVERDIERSTEAINLLHEKLFEDDFESRMET